MLNYACITDILDQDLDDSTLVIGPAFDKNANRPNQSLSLYFYVKYVLSSQKKRFLAVKSDVMKISIVSFTMKIYACITFRGGKNRKN